MTGSDVVSQALFGNIGYTRSDYRIMMTECGNVGNDQYGVGTAVGCLSANGFETCEDGDLHDARRQRRQSAISCHLEHQSIHPGLLKLARE